MKAKMTAVLKRSAKKSKINEKGNVMRLTLTTILILSAISANATTIECFTKFWGSTSFRLSGTLSDSAEISDVQISTGGTPMRLARPSASGLKIMSGKYAGRSSFDLGNFRAPWGDDFGLKLYISQPINEGKTKVVMKNDTAQGPILTNLLCTIE